MNYVSSNNIGLKYQSRTPSGCIDIGVNKFEFVAKTRVLFCMFCKFFSLIGVIRVKCDILDYFNNSFINNKLYFQGLNAYNDILLFYS